MRLDAQVEAFGEAQAVNPSDTWEACHTSTPYSGHGFVGVERGAVMPDRVPSLALIAARVTEERRFIAAHADALDTKAGILLGFAGAFVALTTGAPGWSSQAAQGSAAAAALLAMVAFVPRPTGVLHVGPLRDKYLAAEERLTKRVLLDTEIELREELRALIHAKARLVTLSLGLLALAVVLAFLGSILG